MPNYPDLRLQGPPKDGDIEVWDSTHGQWDLTQQFAANSNLFDVRAYGATGNGVTDDTVAIQATVTAAAVTGGDIYFPQGVYLISAAVVALLPTGGAMSFSGPGMDVATVRMANGAITKGGLVFNLGGANTTFTFREFTIDGNGQNQNWATSTINDFYKGISGDLNNGTTNGAEIVIESIKFKNMVMNSTFPNGIGLNTFGLSTQDIVNLRGETIDTLLFITQAFGGTTPNRTLGNGIFAHNVSNYAAAGGCGIAFEGFGGVSIHNFEVVNDAASPNAQGIRILTANPVSRCAISGGLIVNVGYIVNGGAGGTNAITDTVLSDIVAVGCAGSYDLTQFTSSCICKALIADTCASGGISGSTVFGSFEVGGGGASDAVLLFDISCVNSQNGGIQVNGPMQLINGEVRNSTFGAITFASGAVNAASVVRNVRGYNPVGVVAPAVPLSTAAVAAVAYDRTFYVTTGAGVTTMALQGGPTITLQASTAGLAVRVPAGQTVTPTYANAPTWVVEGE